MNSLDGADLSRILGSFRGTRVWVAGDLMLDEYVAGAVSRISPEAPVPVVKVERSYQRLGGAANVAHCLAALGAEVQLCGVVGEDVAGDSLLAACERVGVDTSAVGQDARWATVRKVRVVAQHQQLLRMDWEDAQPVPADSAERLIERLQSGGRPDAIVLSDYAKGFLSATTVRRLIELGGQLRVPILVDPKVDDLGRFRGATVVTPNLREFAAVVGAELPPVDSAEFLRLAAEHRDRAGLGALIVTLGDRGLLVSPARGEAMAISSTSRDVYDVTGAGDTLLAALALGLAVGADLVVAARIANAAAGVAVRRFGTATVTLDELAHELPGGPASKLYSQSELLHQLAFWRLQGKRIVFTNGCFDVLHAGHLSLLREASSHGDVLLVGLNSDESVARLKGPGRPLNPQRERGEMLAALECVDAVTLFTDDTPLRLIEQVRPAVLVKGADYAGKEVVGREVVEAGGGEVVLCALVEGRSTTGLLKRARDEG